jgi:hypothetical protein
MNRLNLFGAFAALALLTTPLVPISFKDLPNPAKPAGKAEILFDSRQQRRHRARERPVAIATPRKRRRK